MNVYVAQQGGWGSFRHLPLTTSGATLSVEHAYLNALTRGDLSSLKWIEGPLTFYRYDYFNTLITGCVLMTL